MNNNYAIRRLTVLLSAVFMPLFLGCQEFDFGSDLDADDYNIFLIQTGTTKTITFLSSTATPYDWYMCSSAGCETLNRMPEGVARVIGADPNLKITFSNTNAVIEANNSAIEESYYLTIRLEGRSDTITRKIRLIVRKPLNMIFVLDRSGSMECGLRTASAWNDCILRSGHRWDALKDAVENFVTKFDSDESSLPGDRISVVYFSGATVDPPGDFETMKTVGNFQSGIRGNMESPPVQNAPPADVLGRDGTSIGAGVLEAVNARFGGAENTNLRQVIVVFTDGEQNAAPDVAISAGSRQIKAADGTVLLDLNAANVDGIEIYTIGVGALPSVSTLLQGLAGSPSRCFMPTTDNEDEFVEELSGAAFNEIFNKFSPQHIKFVKQKLSSSNSISFSVNKQVSRLFLEAHFDRPYSRTNTRFEIYRNGVPFPLDKTQPLYTPFLTTFIINFEDLPDYTSEGEWTFTVLTNMDDIIDENIYYPGPPSINLLATADDHEVDMSTRVGASHVAVGSKTPITLTLSHQGKPIKNALVKAYIVKPSVDVSDLLARAQVAGPLPVDPELGTCAGQTLNWLRANNPAALDSLKIYFSDSLVLAHKGKGKYEAVYGNWNVTGVHKVIFSAQASDAAYGKLERMKNQTVNVRIPPISFNPKERTFGKDGRVSYLGLRPQYESRGRRYFVGPGYGYAYSVKGAGVERVTVNDECGGRYGISVQAEGDPRVKVYLLDEEIYRGKLSRFDKPYVKYKWGLSAHGGITEPLGKLDTLYVNGGAYAEIDASYQFVPFFSLEARGGYYGFDQGFNILGATLYAKTQTDLRANTLSLAFAAGGGIYKPKNTDSAAGYSLRLGLQWHARPRLEVSLDGGFFTIPQYEYQFLTAGLGLKYRL